MLSKVYFPRVVLPLSSILAKLVDLFIALGVLGAIMLWYGRFPTWGALMLPVLILIMMMTSAGVGMILTSMAIQFRDVKHAMPFVVQLLMYAAPVVYPTTIVPESLRWVYALNPMVGVIEGFRAALLGTRAMPWSWIATGLAVAIIVFMVGLFQFRRQERIFADVA
jgi:lipopolysaccharide transport system permease protein